MTQPDVKEGGGVWVDGGRWPTDVKALAEKWPDMEMCLFVWGGTKNAGESI